MVPRWRRGRATSRSSSGWAGGSVRRPYGEGHGRDWCRAVGLILRNVEVAGATVDVRVDDGVVAATAQSLRPGPSDAVVEGDGGALIPGLHDHHIHVLALAAARQSVEVDPVSTPSGSGFVAALRLAATRGP